MNKTALTLSAACLIVACDGSSSANDGTPKLHPVDEACVEYEMSGQMQNGTTVRCHRDFGYEQYEIQNVSVGIMGMTQTTNSHNITIGDTIYAINLDTNTGTQTTNPMYQSFADALQNSSPEEMSATFLNAMGMTPTGSSQTIAGVSCDNYSSANMGTACFTSDGLMLEQSFMGSTTRATSVAYAAGDDANYTLYQNVPITQGPDLSNGLGGLFGQQ